MENLHKIIQVMLEFLEASFLVLQFSFYTLMTFLTISYADKTILYADQASNLWQQLKLVSDLEFDLDVAWFHC